MHAAIKPRKMRPTIVSRRRKEEAEKAIDELLMRGFIVMYPLTRCTNGCYVAKLKRNESITESNQTDHSS